MAQKYGHRFAYRRNTKDFAPSRLEIMLKKLSRGEAISPDDDDIQLPDNDFEESCESAETLDMDQIPAMEVKEDNDTVETEKIHTKLEEIDISPEEEEYGYYIANDPELSEASVFLQTAIQFALVIKKIDWKIKTCREKMVNEERLIQDLLHEALEPLKNDADSISLYRMIHRAQRRRREYKDLFLVLRVIADYFSAHRNVFDEFLPVVNTAEKKANYYNTRVYIQRSSTKLPVGDKFRNLPKAEQERIMSIYATRSQNESC